MARAGSSALPCCSTSYPCPPRLPHRAERALAIPRLLRSTPLSRQANRDAAPLHALRRAGPVRPSLRRIGIPDDTHVFAVYVWWKRRHCRADTATTKTSPVRSVFDGHEVQEPLSSAVRVAFEMETIARDLRGIGGQFE
jgi:hypothetical protein